MTKESFKKGEKVTYKECSYIIKSINDKWASVWDGYKTYLARIDNLNNILNKRIMKIEDLKNTKIYLSNEEDRREFQEKVFKLGVRWYGGGENVEELDKCFFYIDGDLYLTMGNEDKYDVDFFKKHDYEQIFFHDIESIEEPKVSYNLKPFDRVLVRDNNSEEWHIGFFSTYTDRAKTDYPYKITHGYTSKQCIPYEGNEHLLGTSNSPD